VTTVTADTLPAGVTGDRARALVAKLRLIPDSTRRFDRTELEAWRFYNIKRPVLALLTEHGLPHRRTADGVLFDDYDLRNANLHLSSSSSYRAAHRFWATALSRDPALDPARYEVTYRAACPAPGHAAPCRYRIALPGEVEVDVERSPDTPGEQPLTTVEVTLPNDWPALPPPARAWVDETRGLHLMQLPPVLADDLDFVRRTGLATCTSSARMLLLEGERRGLPVRPAYGFITAPMYSFGHHWVDIRVDGRWVPVDPLLLAQLAAWEALPGDDWSGYRSPGAILSRVSGEPLALLRHNGEPVRPTLATRALN
jgi:hypothetical protein